MKPALAFLFCCIFSLSLFSQGVNNLWLMGYSSWAGPPYGGINMDFSSGLLDITYQSRKMNFSETNGVICDKSGKLLFYSNGIYIANALDSTMLNGDGINPGPFTNDWKDYGLILPQANLVIPFPYDSAKYYLFHQTINNTMRFFSWLLYYSVIDMNGDNGLGAVVKKNTVLLFDSLSPGPLTACKHANGRDWWLIAHQFKTNLYYKYLITPTGINGPYLQNIGTGRGVGAGQTVFSPDGKYFVAYNPIYDLDVFDFDRCTGDFTFKVHVNINDSAAGGGVAFSPNSQILYVSSMSYVYQFDMNATNIATSKTTIAIWDTTYSPAYPLATTFYLSQLAPDGKIYINCGNSTDVMHVVNNPDILGLGSNFCQRCVNLPALNAFTIPNHPNYFLGALSGSLCDTIVTSLTPNPLSKEDGALQIFPNPVVNEEVTFTYAVLRQPARISIFNIEGKEVAEYRLPQWSSVQHLKLPSLAPGIYLARLTEGTQTKSTRFVRE